MFRLLTNSFVILISAGLMVSGCSPRISKGVRKKDIEKDIEILTDKGRMVARLSDSTPLHRNNFIRLVKSHFYDGISFHRVINGFMVQGGDPATKNPKDTVDKTRIPAEFRQTLFHKKGVLAAAREGDDSNPKKGSSYSQFYLVQGRVFTDESLDSTETFRLKGRKLPAAHREVYKTLGGTPHLDQNYTIFGEVIKGVGVIDSIAAVQTTGKGKGDRPLTRVNIIRMKLIPRK